MLALDPCPGGQIRLVALDGRVHRHLFSDPCVQGLVGQRFLEGHRGFSGSHRRAAGREVEIKCQREGNNTDNESGNEPRRLCSP